MSRKLVTDIVAVIVALALVAGVAVFWHHKHHASAPATQQPTTQGSYIALGDSVAAGVGLPDYSDSSACNRTKQAYPVVVAQQLNLQLRSVACSGATTQQGLLGPQDVNQLMVPAQIGAAASSGKPKLITITIGANDLDWTELLQTCHVGLCGTPAQTAVVKAGAASAGTQVSAALAKLKADFPVQPPIVLVTGYYQLFGATLTPDCVEQQGLDATELAWVQSLQTSLNTSLQAAVKPFSFVHFVPVDFSGHQLCATDPWVQGLAAKAPFHPSVAGQAALAKQIVDAYHAAVDTNNGT